MKLRALQAGDVIRIVSPASHLSPDSIEVARSLLESSGYRVEIGRHAFDAHHYLAGTDEARASDLAAAFDDPNVAAVYCSRGGYGCARLLPLLPLDQMAESGKLFVGFSDVTLLHTSLNRRGLATLHAPMGLTFSKPREPWVVDSFLASLAGRDPIPAEAPTGRTVVGGIAVGPVSGGCLVLLADSLGTPEAFDASGKIVLIEDVDENPHRVDAMLTHLLLEGSIRRAAGIVVGEMTGTDDRSDATIGKWPWREIVRDRLENLNIPLITDFPFGHCPQMLSLPLGVSARLDADVGTLRYFD